MAKRLFIIHGWEGFPDEGWFPWLKKECESRGFEVQVPAMPDSEHPKIEAWIPKIIEIVGKADENTHFVGHSMGCQAIMRFVEQLPEGQQIGNIVLVAGFFTLTEESYEDEEGREIARPWLEIPIDTNKVVKNSKKIIGIFSDNDPFVDLKNTEMFKQKLKAKIIVENNKKHFSGSEGVTKLPSVLEEIIT